MIMRIIMGINVVVLFCSLLAEHAIIKIQDLDDITGIIKKSSVKPEDRLIICAINNVIIRCFSCKNQHEEKGYDVIYDASNAHTIVQANEAYAHWIKSSACQCFATEGPQTSYVVSQLRSLGDFIFMTSRPFLCHDITMNQLKQIGISMSSPALNNMITIQGPLEGIPDNLSILSNPGIIYCANGSKKIAIIKFLEMCAITSYKEIVVIEDKLDDINDVLEGCKSIPKCCAILYRCGGRQIEEDATSKS